MSLSPPNPVAGASAPGSFMEAKLPPSSDGVASPAVTPQVGAIRVPRWTYVGSAALVAAAGVWASLPLGTHDVPKVHTLGVRPSASIRDGAPSSTHAALDLDAFRAPIWVLPPEPPAPPPETTPPPPPPPLKLQLLAITSELATAPGQPAVLRATLYDPDTDRLVIVASGEKVGDRAIERINPHEIAIVGPEGKRTLSLADAQPSPSNGARR